MPTDDLLPPPGDLFGADVPGPSGPPGARRGPSGRPGRPGGGPSGPGPRPAGPGRKPGASPVGLVDDDPDDLPDGEDTSWFTGFDELGGEPTPALLAAKAEPLGDPGPAPGRPGAGRPARSNRPAGKAGQRPAGPQARVGGRRKPKEPSKALLALGAVAVLASGLGAVYLFSRMSGEEQAVDDTAVSAPVDGVTTSVPATDGSTTSTPGDTAASPAPGAIPAIKFDEAAVGPLNADTPYTIQVANGPADAQYQLLIDDVAQAEPAAELAPATFPAGLHQIAIDVITPTGTTTIPPAVVYAVGQVPPTPTWWANLSSVDVDDPTEGWGEAVRRFEEFVAAGHTDLKLVPSDWYPSLPAGYWMLYVDGFASSDEATAYCEAKGLTPPDQCFARNFDPGAPAGG